MALFEQISKDIVVAMKAKDKVALEALRNIKKFFLEAKTAPGANDELTDNAAMKMIQEPKFFDVMVTENTFGDILTDEGSVISGSMGLLPSASTGESTPVFEPIQSLSRWCC